MQNYFSPLDKSACVYFFIITMIFFVLLVIALGTEILYLIKHFKDLNIKIISNGIILLFNIFLAYFVNRLLYSMCVKSLV
jgi:hypothetical protein